jgi:hypothetical protein
MRNLHASQTLGILFIMNQQSESWRTWVYIGVYYESIKRKLKTKYICGCRCYERLQPNTKEFTGIEGFFLFFIFFLSFTQATGAVAHRTPRNLCTKQLYGSRCGGNAK